MLVTHFLEEAERLCDRIAVVDSGSVAALDTPAALASATDGEQRIRFQPSVPVGEEQLASLPGVRSVEVHGRQVIVTGTGDVLGTVIAALARQNVVAGQLRVDQTSLEDAFVALTSHDSNDRKETH